MKGHTGKHSSAELIEKTLKIDRKGTIIPFSFVGNGRGPILFTVISLI